MQLARVPLPAHPTRCRDSAAQPHDRPVFKLHATVVADFAIVLVCVEPNSHTVWDILGLLVRQELISIQQHALASCCVGRQTAVLWTGKETILDVKDDPIRWQKDAARIARQQKFNVREHKPLQICKATKIQRILAPLSIKFLPIK